MSQNGATRTERLDAIRSHLYTHGFSSIQALADAVGASLATIRRDLQVLEGEGAISRSHGGARLSVEALVDACAHLPLLSGLSGRRHGLLASTG